MSLIAREIEDHYRQAQESERLAEGAGELERIRTQAILGRYLPPPPATIFDIGGAAGVYAFPLAEQGYTVQLIDPVQVHLDQARSREAGSGVRLASIVAGDARGLDVPSESADAILLLGPLYHLSEQRDRAKALAEARRILRREGILFAAAISRFASLLDGLCRGFFDDPEFRKIIAEDLASGQHRNPGNHPRYFTTAYFHRPEDLDSELREAGFGDVQVLAVEGPAWSAVHFREVWSDEKLRQKLLEFLSAIERESSVLGASAHLLAVARRLD